MHAATAAFTGTYYGVRLTDDADELFSQHCPWSVAKGQQLDPNEGHCILMVAADGTDIWATLGCVTAVHHQLDGPLPRRSMVMITPEDAGTKLIDLDALRADINALGGTEA